MTTTEGSTMTTTLAPPVAPPRTLEERIVEARAALRELANVGDVADIVAYLVQRGIKGIRANSFSCPVAEYVRVTTGYKIALDSVAWRLIDEGGQESVPRAVGFFITHFDLGDFPELQLPGPVVVPPRIEEADRD